MYKTDTKKNAKRLRAKSFGSAIAKVGLKNVFYFGAPIIF